MVKIRNILRSLVFRSQAPDVGISVAISTSRTEPEGPTAAAAGVANQPSRKPGRGCAGRRRKGMVDEVCGVGNVEGGVVAAGPRSVKTSGFLG